MFSLALSNFRSFKNQKFNFSKFNILIGENSSGKSSVLKFLLALKQSFQPPFNREMNLLFKGEFADLGSYKESVYYQDDSLPISFEFSFDEKYNDFFKNWMSDYGDDINTIKIINKYLKIKKKSRTSVRYVLTKELHLHGTIQTFMHCPDIGTLSIEYSNDDVSFEKTSIYGSRCSIFFINQNDDTEYVLSDIEYTKDAFMTLVSGNSLRNQIRKALNISDNIYEQRMDVLTAEQKELIDQSEIIYLRMAYLLVSQNYLKNFLDKIEYINPINTIPNRVYLTTDLRRITSVKNLDDVIEFFSRNDKFTLDVFEDFVEILKNLGIAQNLEIIQDDRLPVRELRIKVNDLYSNIKDVGYGVSLQLPIILKALLADTIKQNKNTIIMIEQPEVHLHPKLHSELISSLVKLSKNTIYFIETHSEHIVRKLQVLVNQKAYNILPEHVTIHYLIRVDNQSEVSFHKIDENGLLNPSFPPGFFDNSFSLAKQLLN